LQPDAVAASKRGPGFQSLIGIRRNCNPLADETLTIFTFLGSVARIGKSIPFSDTGSKYSVSSYKQKPSFGKLLRDCADGQLVMNSSKPCIMGCSPIF
jgi:hypothetical protein